MLEKNKNATKTIANKNVHNIADEIFGSPCLTRLIQVRVFYVWGRRRCIFCFGLGGGGDMQTVMCDTIGECAPEAVPVGDQ